MHLACLVARPDSFDAATLLKCNSRGRSARSRRPTDEGQDHRRLGDDAPEPTLRSLDANEGGIRIGFASDAVIEGSPLGCRR